MDFELPGPDDPRRLAVRAWLAEHPSPSGRQLAEAGYVAPHWPAPWGLDADPIQQVLIDDELAAAGVRRPANMIGIGWAGPTILHAGSPEQKDRYLVPLLAGEEIWCQLFSEPSAGSDLAGLRTSAVRDGDDWVINGQKIWTTGAQYCKWGMIVTRTDPTAEKHKGITYFIVDMKSPGIEIRPIRQINGLSGFNEVFFTDVRVPDKNRVGGVNDGWRGALTTLMNERHAIGGGGAGGPDFVDLVRLAQRTEWSGRAAFEDHAVRQRLARFYIRLKGLQYTGYRTQTALSRGQTPGPESSIGKLVGAPLRQEMSSFAVELQGIAGAMIDRELAPDEGVWQQMYLGTPGLRLAGGTDEILRNIIAERVLGLPPEIRVDKGLSFKDVPTGPKN